MSDKFVTLEEIKILDEEIMNLEAELEVMINKPWGESE